MARPSKKPKPTFDVAREPIAPSGSGWVYRSDSAPPAPPAVPRETREPQIPEVLEKAAYLPVREPFRPHQAVDAHAERSWLQTGVYLMVLPMSIGMTLMFAPVTWLLRGRSRR